MMKKFRNAITLLTIFLASLSSMAVPVTGEWILHPSLDIYSSTTALASQSTNNIQKLIDGNRYVYALITSAYYANSSYAENALRNTPVNIARLDKNDPEGKIEPLLPKLRLSGTDVIAAEYSHLTGCLALNYSNSAFDFIFDDGRILSNNDLKNVSLPGGKKVNSISFSIDGKKAIAATGFGLVIFDVETGSLSEIYNLSENVNFANIVGDRIVAATDNKIHFFPVSSHPASLSSTPTLKARASTNQYLVNEEGGLKLRYGIYPADDRSFVFIGECYNRNSFDGISANLAVIPENPEEDPCMVDYYFTNYVAFNPMAANTTLARGFREQGLVSPTRDGLMAHTDERIYLMPYRKEAPAYTDAKTLRTYLDNNFSYIFKDASAYTDIRSGQPKYKITATADGETFYQFLPRKGLIIRKPGATDYTKKTTVWETVGEPYELNANTAGFPGYIYYSPKYGMMVHNRGVDRERDFANGMSDGFCSYRNGVWTQQSLAHRNFANGFMYNGTQVAVLPRYGVPDPVNPDYVYTNGRLAGLRRENLADPDDHLLLTTSAYMTSLPYRQTVVQRMLGSVYSTLCAFSEPSFDNDGTMWTTFNRLANTNYDPEQHGELWYWTADDRIACKTPADYPSHPMKFIRIPDLKGSNCGHTMAAKLEQNRNLVVVTSGDYDNDTYIYDHNGTPEDTSDDRVAVLTDMIDENGDETLGIVVGPCKALEDPYDGAFIIGHRYGMFSISREQAFNYDKPHYTRVLPVDAETGGKVVDFGASEVRQIAVDGELNKWVAFNYGGVACLSPDRSKILAWYTTSNSNLPSNETQSVAYNPETNSIFVGTTLGVAELVLDGTENALLPEKPSVSPRVVEAHYNGYVTFSGLTDAKDYTLIGPDNKEILLGHPNEGRIQWYPANHPSGIYRLKSAPEIEVYVN